MLNRAAKTKPSLVCSPVFPNLARRDYAKRLPVVLLRYALTGPRDKMSEQDASCVESAVSSLGRYATALGYPAIPQLGWGSWPRLD